MYPGPRFQPPKLMDRMSVSNTGSGCHKELDLLELGHDWGCRFSPLDRVSRALELAWSSDLVTCPSLVSTIGGGVNFGSSFGPNSFKSKGSLMKKLSRRSPFCLRCCRFGDLSSALWLPLW
ncbi:hypothetical protein V6N11_039152 [Hibiscus sabdariffa]|uniref:Uncharacterized protein n=1 Tax=Hibiscus sabdariffa TaxID=183260 RepID=A0ABR2SM34_9ROSI